MIIILRQCVFYNCITFICTKHNADWRIVALVHHFPCVIVFAYDGIFKKVGYLVRERYLGGRVYLVSVNVRITVYRARKRGAVCEHFDYFVFLRRYGYYDRIAEVRLAVGYARNGAVSVRVVPYARIHDGGNRRVDIGSRSRERVLGEGNLSRNVTATKQSHLRFAYRG